jgi:hypothetical protein
LQDHWETHGAKWIFIVQDAGSASQADSYFNGHYVTFGWRTNDADNTEGSHMISYSGIYGGVPWTGVIDAETMELVYDEPDTSYLDIVSIAVELASD